MAPSIRIFAEQLNKDDARMHCPSVTIPIVKMQRAVMAEKMIGLAFVVLFFIKGVSASCTGDDLNLYCPEDCCGSYDDRYCCSDDELGVGEITGSVVGTCLLVTTIIVVICCCCRRSRGNAGHVVDRRGQEMSTSVVSTSTQQLFYDGRPMPTQGQPAYHPKEPAYNPKQPTDHHGQLDYNPGQPAYHHGQPAYNPGQSAHHHGQPAYNPGQPAYHHEQPAYNPRQPAYHPGRREHDHIRPPYPSYQGHI